MSVGPIYQMAFVVPDIAAAICEWVRLRAAGPFYRFDHFAFEDAVCAAGMVAPDISIALGQSGGVNIELIEVHGNRPTIFSGGPRLHHVARRSTDVDAAAHTFALSGAPTSLRAAFAGGVPVAFVDTRAALGCLTEVIAADAGVDAMLAQMAADAAGWDGRDPVRRF